MARASRIKELQELLGFSLAEVRVVLDTEDIDVLDRVRSEYRRSDPTPARRRQLLEEAIEANDRLLDRLDDTLRRIGAFREERAVKATRLRQARQEIDCDTPSGPRRAPAASPTRPPRRSSGRAAPGPAPNRTAAADRRRGGDTIATREAPPMATTVTNRRRQRP